MKDNEANMKKWITLLTPYAIAGGVAIAALAAKSSNQYVDMVALAALAMLAHYNRNQAPPS